MRRRVHQAGCAALLIAAASCAARETATPSVEALSPDLQSAIAAYSERLDANKLALFDDAQAAWMRYRDRHCRFAASGVASGSAYPMIYQRCLQRVGDQRLAVLEQLASCQEGDLSCPVFR